MFGVVGVDSLDQEPVPGVHTTDRERGPVLRLTPRAFADFTTGIRQDAAL